MSIKTDPVTINGKFRYYKHFTIYRPESGNEFRANLNTGQTLRGRQVLVLIDGIPQSTPLRNGARDLRVIDPSVIERIEVIKGASSIYGNGADGGIINYITRKTVEKRKSQEFPRQVLRVSHTVEH